jgi:hypothetical protein
MEETMARSHPKSARPDQARSHRSQAKAAKAQPILLDRLDAALCRQNVTLKRAALQSVAAAAFGFHNANEFAAAGLVPPAAEVLGRAEIDGDLSLLVLRDPTLGAIYGIDEDYLRETQASSRTEHYGLSPYGDLLDLSGVLESRKSGVPVGPIADVIAFTPSPFHLYADETLHLATVDLGTDQAVQFIDLTREAIDARIAEWCRENWAQGANPELDPTTLTHQTTVLRAYFAGDHAGRITRRTTQMPSPPQHRGGLELPIWVAYHSHSGGRTVYADTTEIGLHRQVLAVLEDLWDDVAEEAGEFSAHSGEIGALIALYERHSDDTLHLDHATVTLPGGSLASDPGGARGVTAAAQPTSDRHAWQNAVINGETLQSYADWVKDAGEADTGPGGHTHRVDDAWTVISEKEHPVYLLSDWKAARSQDAATPSYRDWVTALRAENVCETQWIRPPYRDALMAGGRRCIIHIHGVAQRRGFDRPAGEIIRFAPGDIVTVHEADFSGDDGYAHLLTQDGGQILLESRHRNGFLPLSLIENPGVASGTDNPEAPVGDTADGPYLRWLAAFEQALGRPAPRRNYRSVFARGVSPDEAADFERHADELDATDEADMTGDVFLEAVANQVGQRDLTREPDFQRFCTDLHGSVTPEMAATVWKRR